jgi:hypothetical protein
MRGGSSVKKELSSYKGVVQTDVRKMERVRKCACACACLYERFCVLALMGVAGECMSLSRGGCESVSCFVGKVR